MSNNRIKIVEELLDERLSISKMREATMSDKFYYKGMLAVLKAMGYDWVIKDGKHTLYGGE